jgi:hypothetical protein
MVKVIPDLEPEQRSNLPEEVASETTEGARNLTTVL